MSTKSINTALQDKFLGAFFSTRFGKDFYLTGGTALARFYFNHRESIDLDLFTQNQKVDFSEVNLEIAKIGKSMKQKIKKNINTKTFIQFIFENKGSFGLKIDLVKDVPIHFGGVKTKGKVRLDSIENIGSNKILAIFGRTDAKDFIDLHHIIKNTKFSFDYLYKLAKQKDLGLNKFYLANMMVEIKSLEHFPKTSEKLNKKELVEFFTNLSDNLYKKIKPVDKL